MPPKLPSQPYVGQRYGDATHCVGAVSALPPTQESIGAGFLLGPALQIIQPLLDLLR